MINFDNPIKNLPDAYDKTTGSNNFKLLQINKNTTNLIKSGIANIFKALNIDNAEGKMLDDIYGGRLHLRRGSLTDDKYIIRLRTKMMQNIVTGSFPDLMGSLAYALQCDKSAIHIIESDTPNRVIIKNIPLESVLNAGFTADEITNMIESMLPLGVKVEERFFTGTFEFGGENEYDENKGFANDDGTIGGYLGLYEEAMI